MLVATNSSAQTSPNFWVDPRNGVSYPLVVQQPTYSFDSSQDIQTMPVTASGPDSKGQLLMNLSKLGRQRIPLVTSQLNIRPVFDVDADVQGRDLYATSRDIARIINENQPPAEKAIHVSLTGQVNHDRKLLRSVYRDRAGRGPRLSLSGDQLPELDRPAHRPHGGAVRPVRRDVDAVPHTNPHERAGADWERSCVSDSRPRTAFWW